MTETTIPTPAVTKTPKPVKPKAPKKSKVTKKVAKKAVKTPAKKDDKPKVRWGSLMSIDNDKLVAALKGEKNAMSAQGISKKYGCTIWTAKRSVMRATELNPKLKVQVISRQEGKAGVPSACYYFA